MLHDCRTNTNWTGQGKTRQDSTKSINNINTAWQLEHAKYHRFLDFFKALMSMDKYDVYTKVYWRRKREHGRAQKHSRTRM